MMDEDQLAKTTIDAAFKVHKHLGPGLLESVYETCLAREMEIRSIPFSRQVLLPIVYEGLSIDNAFRIDLLVGNKVVVEIKASEKNNPLHAAQILTYMRLTGSRLGILINFNVPLIKDGIKRLIL